MADATINQQNESLKKGPEETVYIDGSKNDDSIVNVLLKIFGIDKKELEALGEVNVSQLKGILFATLKEQSVGITTALLAFVPFIGEYFLAGKAVYAQGEKVKESIIKKIKDSIPRVDLPNIPQVPQIQIPQVPQMPPMPPMPQVPQVLTTPEYQTLLPSPSQEVIKGGGRPKSSITILRRIEKSKQQFHNTNKSFRIKITKPRKTQRRRLKRSVK